jgi:hypothetical protein
MKRALLVTSLVCSALVGCGDDGKGGATLNSMPPTGNEEAEAGEQDGSSAGESGGQQDTGSDPNPTSSTAPGDTGSSSDGMTSDATVIFIEMLDVPDDAKECDPFTQDCPDGQKCVPWANDGGTSWNADKCEMIREGDTKVPGDACVADAGGVGGIDNCVKGAFCWNVNAMMQGFCVALCTGTAESPMCEAGTQCAVYNEGTLPLCLPECQPDLQDCPEGEACIKSPTMVGFLCVPDASGEEGQPNDPCEFANACDPGQVCSPTTASNECDPNAIGCCQPICSLSENNCVAPQKCTMFEQNPDPEFGFCSI